MFARFVRPFVLILLLGATVCFQARAEAPFSFASTPGKLPKTVVPKNYSLRLQPDLEKLTTHGSVMIDLEVLKPVRKIVFNALDLEITKALLSTNHSLSSDTRTMGWASLTAKPDTNEQTVTLAFSPQLSKGKHRLYLEFNGRLRDQEQGLFYVKYNSPSGKKIMLASQMEATDARRMFPCWDEPVFRATVDFTVVLPEKLKAISNMPVEEEKSLSGNLKETRFARTPPMASYLIVLVCGELEELKDEAEGVKLRVITTEGKKEQGRYALDATKKLLAYYNQYFGIKYPLPKLDQIAVPGGFAGAMENWGGITYSENILLFNPKTSSQQTKRDIFVTVAHEMSHQWFGNLVTTAWWNDLWLNEGFATWMETKATDHFNPDWQMFLSADADKSSVMSGDARASTHPIEQPVANESEANDAFDEITYQKGGAFLRMFEDYLGPETFRRGVHDYLAGHRYSSATTADLWAALEKVSGKPVKAIAPGWTEQPGVPVINVKAEISRATKKILISQERLTVRDPKAEALRWQIPVSLLLMTPANPISHLLLVDKNTLAATYGDCGAPVKINAGDVGYYRASYDPQLFSDILRHIDFLGAADRLNLLNDSWAMVEANRSSITNYFTLVDSLRQDTNYAIWNQIVSSLLLVNKLQQNQPGQEAYRRYSHRLLEPQFRRLGWTPRAGESVNDPLLRAKIISALGRFDDPFVITEAKSRFDAFVKQPDSLSADLRTPVIFLAGRHADQKTYDALHTLAREAKGTEERELYYTAMAAALDPELAKATLAISLTDETVPHEASGLVAQVAGEGDHRESALEFARKHLPELLAKVDSFERNNYLPSIYATFSDDAHAQELEEYVKSKISDDAVTKARQVAEAIRLQAELKRRELPALDRWIAAQSSNTDLINK